MQITIAHEQGNVPITVIQLNGQLDGQTYQSLIAKVAEISKEGAKNIILDMTNLTYISSAGLVSLHTIAKILRGEALPDPDEGWAALKSMEGAADAGVQKHVKLLNPRPEIVSVLDMVGFSAFFEIYTDKQAAIDSF